LKPSPRPTLVSSGPPKYPLVPTIALAASVREGAMMTALVENPFSQSKVWVTSLT
jgi:hypothetical protein